MNINDNANVSNANADNVKHKTHFLDLKIPLGCLIVFYGIVLVVYGLLADQAIYQKSLNININVIWGASMLVIGAVLLFLAVISSLQRKKQALMQ